MALLRPFAIALLSHVLFISACSDEPVATEPGIDLLASGAARQSIAAQQLRFELAPNGALVIEVDSGATDPFILFDLPFDAKDADRIEIEVTGPSPQDLHLYWSSRTSCRSMSERCKIALRPSATEDKWIAETGKHTWWRGEVTQLRIDFNNASGLAFELRSVRLLSDDSGDALAHDTAKNRLAKPKRVATNMFDLEMQKVFDLDLEKKGGGIGATASELILATGDGRVRVVDLHHFEVSEPAIALPRNNDAEAVDYARGLEPDSFGDLAATQVEPRLRYDDILVLDTAGRRQLILSYGHFDPAASCFTHRVSRLPVPNTARLDTLTAGANDWTLLFTSKPCFDIKRGGNVFAGHQSGGRLVALDSSRVLLALGDYEFDGWKDVPSYPQDRSADYGKIIEIDVASGATKPISIGHRNPQGITIDRNGTIWSTEHGPQGGDEINEIERGANYGWPVVTQGIMYGNQPWPFNPKQGRHDGYAPPAFGWVPSIGVSNLDESEGFHPLWEGDLLVFTLKDSSIERLRVLDGHVLFDEHIPLPVDEPIRYGMNHAATGSLYLWTDEGVLYRVTPAEEAWTFLEESEAAYLENDYETNSR